MKGHIELLCYSDKQRQLIQTHGDDAGVVLVDGSSRPFLTTETVTNVGTVRWFGLEKQPMRDPTALKSAWDDAVIIHSSEGEGYQRLVDGTGKVTDEGKAWCAASGIDATPEAVRAAAEVPRRTMKTLQLRK